MLRRRLLYVYAALDIPPCWGTPATPPPPTPSGASSTRYSAIVFSKTPVSHPMSGTTFAMAGKRDSAASMMLSKSGAVLTDDRVTIAESVASGR